MHSTEITVNKYCIINFKAKRIDFNCSHHKKKVVTCDEIEVLANATMAMTLQYTNVSKKKGVVDLKLT